MPDFKAAIFDLDGTLLDSMGIWEQIDNEFLKKRGFEATPDYIQAITPLGFRDAAAYTIERFGLAETPEALVEEWGMMCRRAYEREITLKPHAEAYLLALKQDGVKLAVATALDPEQYIPALENNGVIHLFDAFASLKEVSRGKGFPDIYWLAANRLEMEPCDCMVFEDILAGIAGAKSGGFKTCGVYDNSSAHEWDKIYKAADKTIIQYSAVCQN